MKIKIDSTNRIIAYVYIGELEDSIEVEDYYFTDIHIYNYYYENGEIVKKIDLVQLKYLKREELKVIREKKQNADLEYKGHIFQATEKDMRNIETKYNAIIMKLLLNKPGEDIYPYLTSKIKWTLKNNKQIELRVSEILRLYIAWDDRRTEVFNYCNDVLYKKLDDATTIEEIEAIKWE